MRFIPILKRGIIRVVRNDAQRIHAANRHLPLVSVSSLEFPGVRTFQREVPGAIRRCPSLGAARLDRDHKQDRSSA